MTPIRLGITGGIGSGKSVVSRILRTLGIPVFDCDAESKRLCVVHPGIREQLIALVGPEVYLPPIFNYQLSITNYQLPILNSQFSIINYQLLIINYQLSILNSQLSITNYQLPIINYQLNKPLLSEYLFASAEHVRQVNAIIHPAVRDAFVHWADKQSSRLVGIESAILFEAGFDDVVDSVVMVAAPLELRVKRAMQRDGAPKSAIEERIRQQMPDEEKQSRSQFVLVNDGKTALIPQVLDVVDTLSQKYCLSSQP